MVRSGDVVLTLTEPGDTMAAAMGFAFNRRRG